MYQIDIATIQKDMRTVGIVLIVLGFIGLGMGIQKSGFAVILGVVFWVFGLLRKK